MFSMFKQALKPVFKFPKALQALCVKVKFHSRFTISQFLLQPHRILQFLTISNIRKQFSLIDQFQDRIGSKNSNKIMLRFMQPIIFHFKQYRKVIS